MQQRSKTSFLKKDQEYMEYSTIQKIIVETDSRAIQTYTMVESTLLQLTIWTHSTAYLTED
jgi:hypothetical protein